MRSLEHTLISTCSKLHLVHGGAHPRIAGFINQNWLGQPKISLNIHWSDRVKSADPFLKANGSALTIVLRIQLSPTFTEFRQQPFY